MKISGIKDHSNNNFLYFAMHIERVKLISWFTFSNCVPHQNASDSTEPISEFTFVDVHGYVDHIIPITGMTWNFIVIYYILLGNKDRIHTFWLKLGWRTLTNRYMNINQASEVFTPCSSCKYYPINFHNLLIIFFTSSRIKSIF